MKHILIVDDEKDFAQTLKIRLEAESDYVVSMAQNGEEALRIIQRGAPDLIVMDVLMPKMDGLTTLKAINTITEKKVPVIVMTGKAVMTREAFQLEGACDFLLKPFDGAVLAKRVKELLALPA